MSSQIQLQ